MMKHITFQNHKFVLHPKGMLIWPAEDMAVVADLHLEKGSYFAQHNQLIPPYDSLETLQQLEHALTKSSVRKLLLLGDSFHDTGGYVRMDQQARALFDRICKEYELIWIAGNHDEHFVPDCAEALDEITIDNLTFRHIAAPDAANEISGHYHPKASVRLKGGKVSRPCFIEDNNRMILPAFGVYTGGMDIRAPEISKLFTPDFCAHLCGRDTIYSVPGEKLRLPYQV